MESLKSYILNEGLESSNKLPGYKIGIIDVKDRYAPKGSPQHKYTLVLFPIDKTKDVLVWRNFAWYVGGYDQGHASARKYYLNNAITGSKGNGSGVSKEEKPMLFDLDSALEDINDYLTKGHTYSKIIDDKIKDNLKEWKPGTKLSDIKSSLS